MQTLASWVLRHRLLVAGLWMVVAVSGGVLAPTTVGRLSFDFALPGQAPYETNQEILDQFGGGGVNDPLLVVVRGSDAAAQSVSLAGEIVQKVPQTRTVTAQDPGAESLAPAGGGIAVVVVYPPALPGEDPYVSATPVLRAVVSDAVAQGVDAALTGFVFLSEGDTGGADRGVLFEVLLGALGALVVLALVFGSLLAGLPLLVAAVSILGTFLALLGLTFVAEVSFIVQFLVGLIGLGVAIDYSLLVVTRWREEAAHGADNDAAVMAAMMTAGRSVFLSGVTVAISLAALVVIPVPFLRSIGYGGLLIPLLSVATSLTLVPALLSAVGPRLSWPRRKPADPRSRFWASVARVVLAHRWATVIGSLVVLGVLAAPVLGLSLGSGTLSGVAGAGAASTAAVGAVDAGVPGGVLRPTEVVVPEPDVASAVDRLRAVPGVAAVATPSGAGWRSQDRQLLQVWTTDDPASSAGKGTVERLMGLASAEVGVGGSAAEDAGFVDAVYGHAIWVALVVALVTFVLLARALRSLWLPVKALALNVLSIAAAYGITVWIWQGGHGTQLVFGQEATATITTWVPVAAFSFLFGLSMDYEVFILSRIREAYDQARDADGTDHAVVEGIAYTGRLVTSAALILFLAFVALSTAPGADIKILATVLALGIAIDAVIVRGLLAPALVGVLGRANWTLPGPLASVLRTR